MEIGIGLPASIPGVHGDRMIDWARRAEDRGFSTLGAIDRLVYDNYEPLVTFAAAAAVTKRIRLTTSILLGPLRANHALLAKQAATIDRLSGGRLVIGIAVGGREDDFVASGVDYHRRGRELDALLQRVRSIWRDRESGIGPAPTAGGPPLIVGGNSPAAMRRMARFGDGWFAGSGPPEAFAKGAAAARQHWTDAGREGAPRMMALAYFALGDDAVQDASRTLRDYYAFGGPYADQVVASAVTSRELVAERVREMEAAGCDELVMVPCATGLEEVDRLAVAVGL